MIKFVVVFAVLVTLANCDKFSEDEINIAQNQLINKTIAELTEISKNKLTAIPNIIKMINSHLANMDKNMMAEGERREKEGLPLIKEFFENIHRWVYLWGKNEALAVDFPWYLAHNSTDGKVALAKFAATTVVIDWRTELDAERRTVHPTECKDEQGGWADWKVETDKVVAVLKKLIPQLKENKADFWAHQHQRMLDYIEEGIPKVNEKIKAEKDEQKRAKYLCCLVEDLNLLNTVASSRPPAK